MILASLSLLLRRWEEQFNEGRDLSARELCPDDPALAEELRRAIELLRPLRRLVQGDDNGAPGPPMDSQRTQGLTTPLSDLRAPLISGPPDYEIEGELGRGGMGVVYRARQRHLNRLVALKMVLAGGHASAEERLRFLAEAEAAAGIQHPGVVQIHAFGTHEGTPFFALEYCPGGSLASRLRGRPLPPREAARLIEQVARATQAAHDRGIIHRDLKPGNVLLDATGQPKVTDFGLAKRLDAGAGLTRTGSVLGTPSYMAPEQASGHKEVGPAADVYALGAILYECLTGKPPFLAANAFDTIVQVVNEEPVPPRRLNPQLPRDVENVCLLCLEKRPERRYASAGALADDLARFLAGDPVRARALTRAERVARWCRKRPAVAGLLAAVVATLLLGSTIATLFAFRARAEAARARQFAEDVDDKAKELEQTLDQAEGNLVTGLLQPLGHRERELGEAEVEALWRLAGVANDRIRLRFLDDMTRDDSAARRVLRRAGPVARALAGTDEERAARLARHLLDRRSSPDASPEVKDACLALAVALAPADADFARQTVPALMEGLKHGGQPAAHVARAEAIARQLPGLPAAERPRCAEAAAGHVLRLLEQSADPRTSCRLAGALVRLSDTLDRERAGRLCLEAVRHLEEVDAAIANPLEGKLLAEAVGPLLDRLPARDAARVRSSAFTRLLRLVDVNLGFVDEDEASALMALSVVPLCRGLSDKEWERARRALGLRVVAPAAGGSDGPSPGPDQHRGGVFFLAPGRFEYRRALSAWEWPAGQQAGSGNGDVERRLALSRMLLALASSTSAPLNLEAESPHLQALLAGKGAARRLASWRQLVAPLKAKDAERALDRVIGLGLGRDPGLFLLWQPFPEMEVDGLLPRVLSAKLPPGERFGRLVLPGETSFFSSEVNRRDASDALAELVQTIKFNQSAFPVAGASTVGLLASPGGAGPVLAASALFPGRPNKSAELSVDLLELLPRVAPAEANRVARHLLPELISDLGPLYFGTWTDADLIFALDRLTPWLSSRDREWALLRVVRRLEELDGIPEAQAYVAELVRVLACRGTTPAVSRRVGALTSKLLAGLEEASGSSALPVAGASTVGLLASPGGAGPVLAASALFPGRCGTVNPDVALFLLVRLLPALEPAQAARVSSRCLAEMTRRKVGLKDDATRWLIDLFLLAQSQRGRERQVFDQVLNAHCLELRTDNLNLNRLDDHDPGTSPLKRQELRFPVRLATEMALLPPEQAALLAQYLIEAVLRDRPVRPGTLAPWHVAGAVTYLRPAQLPSVWRKVDARLRAARTVSDVDNLLPLLRVLPAESPSPVRLSCTDNLVDVLLATREPGEVARVATALGLLAEGLKPDRARSLHRLVAATLLENWAGAPERDRPSLEEAFALHVAGLDNAGCGEVLRIPFCVGRMQRLVLAELSRRAGQRFDDHFAAVRWLVKTGTPPRDAPPERGRALSTPGRRTRSDVWAEVQPSP